MAQFGQVLLFATKIFGFLSLASFKWFGVLGFVAAAIALATDGILQMTGKGNLGIADMIANLRLFGKESLTIGDSLIISWMGVLKSWNRMSYRILQIWEIIKFGIMESGGYIKRGLISVAEFVYDKFLWLGEKIVSIVDFRVVGRQREWRRV
jgi:hypothetical protein